MSVAVLARYRVGYHFSKLLERDRVLSRVLLNRSKRRIFDPGSTRIDIYGARMFGTKTDIAVLAPCEVQNLMLWARGNHALGQP